MEKYNTLWKFLTAGLAVTTVAAVIVAVTALQRTPQEPILVPNIAPSQMEQSASSLYDGDNEPQKMEQDLGGGSVSVTYSSEVTVSLSTEKAYLMFQNPSVSNQNMLLRIEVDGVALAQSETIPIGYGIDELPLQGGVQLSEGVYNGEFRVYYYDPTSGTKANIDTKIPIEITVVS